MRRCPVRRPMIIEVNCPRCGNPVLTSNGGIHSHSAWRKWHGICSACVTPEEGEQMRRDIAAGILAPARGEVFS
jgi:hypothetical protein